MRFLIFNLVVGAAIAYLVTGGDTGPAGRPADMARQAVSAAVDMAKTATDKVAGEVKAPAADTARKTGETKTPQAAPAAPQVANAAPPVPAPHPAEKPAPAAEEPAPVVKAAPPKAAATEAAQAAKPTAPAPAKSAPVATAASEPQYVASRPVHAAPPPGQVAAVTKSSTIAKPATKDPEVLRRRAEVLGTPAKSAASAKFALKDGEKLMSPKDRARELSRLADDMEMVYFNSLGN